MMVALLAVFTAVVAGQTLQLLPQQSDARCLDGTPAGYYIRANSSVSKWIIYFEGGGW